jgi:hypothetical protein
MIDEFLALMDDSDGNVRAGTTNTTNTTNRCGGRDVARNVSTTKTAFTIRVDGWGRAWDCYNTARIFT